MNWLPVIGMIIGFMVVYALPIHVPGGVAAYISLATLSAMDTMLGGVRSGMEGKFHVDVFASGFVVNTLLAALLAYIGDQIGVDLFLAAVVALGGRMFLNLSLIRRFWLTQRSMVKQQREMEQSTPPMR